MKNYLLILLIWNIVVMLIYGIDKLCAKIGRWRISEASLLISASLFGGLGAMLGMIIFNHKTRKRKFCFLVPVIFVVEFSALCWLLKIWLL